MGVAPIGLADGYLSNRPGSAPYALLGGRRVPIRGVSLEYLSLDLEDIADARVGDEIVLLGRSGDEEILLDDIASWRGTALHEALMSFEGRLRARYVGSPGET